VDTLVRTGAYPVAFGYRDGLARWSAYVRNAIVEPAIGRDILALAAVREPGLSRRVFAVCASSPAQVLSLQKIQVQLNGAGALETIAHPRASRRGFSRRARREILSETRAPPCRSTQARDAEQRVSRRD
jgi:hypothetical protein